MIWLRLRDTAAARVRWAAQECPFQPAANISRSRVIMPCFTASPIVQRTIFFENGGQPGHRGAWIDDEVNRRSSNYFRNTLPALDRAYLRPRFPGYLHFQDFGGAPIREYLMKGGDAKAVLAELKRLFKEAKELYA